MPRRIRRKKYSNQLLDYFHSVGQLMEEQEPLQVQISRAREADHVEIPWPSYQDVSNLDNKGRERNQ